jgi:sulfatase maturation enzyme AslB (radical SAM superfamily)
MPWILSHMHSFSSNGTLYFTPKVQEFLNKYYNIVNISITVDGDKTRHDKCRLFPNGEGSYDLSIKAALKELELHKYAGTKITLSPDNINYIFNGITNLIQLGFNEIHANCCFEDVWTKESAINLLNELIKLADWIKENNLYDKIYLSLLNPKNYLPTQKVNLN